MEALGVRRTEPLLYFLMWFSSQNSHPYAFPGAICSQPWHINVALVKSWGSQDECKCVFLYFFFSCLSFGIQRVSLSGYRDATIRSWTIFLKYMQFSAEAKHVRHQCGESNQVCFTAAGWGSALGKSGEIWAWCLFMILSRTIKLNKCWHLGLLDKKNPACAN